MNKPELNRNKWNERLDENLEDPNHSNPTADQKADEFAEAHGSEKLRVQGEVEDLEDNMALNQPKPGTPKDGEIEREE